MATRNIVPRADGEGSLGTSDKKWGTIHAKHILTNDAASHNSIYRGAEITDDWATIKANIQAGNFENYYIGDYKQITLTTGETVIMEIAGINCYKNWDNTAIGNHIDFISRDCLATFYQFNTTATNNGMSSNTLCWYASGLKKTLQDTTDGVITTLPTEVRNVLDAKLTYLEQRYSSGGAVSADTGAMWRPAGYLWVPAETEVFDHPSWSEIGYGTAGFLQYPIFRLNPSKIVKGEGNGGNSTAWWTLSANSGDATGFCFVQASGYSKFMDANNSMCVPLCFRIA